MHLPAAWAFSGNGQVTATPAPITPFDSFSLLLLCSSLETNLLFFDSAMATYARLFLFLSASLHRHKCSPLRLGAPWLVSSQRQNLDTNRAFRLWASLIDLHIDWHLETMYHWVRQALHVFEGQIITFWSAQDIRWGSDQPLLSGIESKLAKLVSIIQEIILVHVVSRMGHVRSLLSRCSARSTYEQGVRFHTLTRGSPHYFTFYICFHGIIFILLLE